MPGDRISVPAALLWTIISAVTIGIGGGGFWMGVLSTRVANLETDDGASKKRDDALVKINIHLAQIDERLKFLIPHAVPGQQGEEPIDSDFGSNK